MNKHIFYIFFLLLANAAFAITNITGCTALNIANETYVLMNDFGNAGTNCFTFGAVNVTLDCNGHEVQGKNSAPLITMNNLNSTLINCVFISNTGGQTVFNYLIIQPTADGSLVSNNSFWTTDSGNIFVVIGSDNVNFTNNRLNSAWWPPTCGSRTTVSIGGDNVVVDNNYFTGGGACGGINTALSLNLVSNSNITNNIFSETSGRSKINIVSSSNINIINNTYPQTDPFTITTSLDVYIKNLSISYLNSYLNVTYSNNSLITDSNFNSFVFSSLRDLVINNITVGSTFENLVGSIINTNFQNSTLRQVTIRNSSSGYYVGNIFGPSATDSLSIESTSGNNTFYWNNFTNTAHYYATDANGSNYYNYSGNGTNMGNLWYNVIVDTVKINGSVKTFIPGFYYGSSGTDYPYNNTTALGKLIGNITDYAPFTINGVGNLITAVDPISSGTTTGDSSNFLIPANKNITATTLGILYYFYYWSSSGDCVIANINSNETEVQVSSGTCTVTAHFNSYDECMGGYIGPKSYIERYISCSLGTLIGNSELGGLFLGLIIGGFLLTFLLFQNTTIEAKIVVILSMIILVSIWAGWIMYLLGIVFGLILFWAVSKVIWR